MQGDYGNSVFLVQAIMMQIGKYEEVLVQNELSHREEGEIIPQIPYRVSIELEPGPNDSDWTKQFNYLTRQPVLAAAICDLFISTKEHLFYSRIPINAPNASSNFLKITQFLAHSRLIETVHLCRITWTPAASTFRPYIHLCHLYL